MRKTSNFFILSIFSLVLIAGSLAEAQSALTYQGRIIKPDGYPLDADNVHITIQVKSPGTESCLLYQETHVVDMRDSGGIFTLNIGTGARASASVDGGFPLGKVFSNTSEDLTPLPNCDFSNKYRPNLADVRKLIVSFNDGSGLQTLQAQNINFVPFAIEASQITGFTADNLLRVAHTNVPAFTPTQFNTLMDLLTGNSPLFTRPNELSGSPMPAMATGGLLSWDGTSWQSFTLPSSVSSVTAGTGLNVGGAPGSITSTGTLNLTDTGVTAGTYGGATVVPQIIVDAQGRLTSVTAVPISSAANFSGSLVGDVTGTQGATVVGALQGNPVSNVAPTSNQVLKWNGTAWAPGADSFSGTFTGDVAGGISSTVVGALQGHAVSNTAPGANEVLKWNGTAWAPAADSYTGSFAGDTSGPATATVVGALQGKPVSATAPGANEVLKWNGTSWAPAADSFSGTFAGDVSGSISATIVGALQGKPVSATAPGANEVLKWNGTSWAPAADGFTGTFAGDVTGGSGSTLVGALQGRAVSNTAPTTNQILKWNGTSWAPGADNNSGGSLTSVGVTMPSIFAVTGSPVTGAGGTVGVTLEMQAGNSVFAGPNGTTGAPTFRNLVELDLPTIVTAGKVSGNAITSGTIGGSTALSTTGNISTSGNIITSGRMVASASSTTTAKLEVAGQVLSKVYNAGAATSIDWNNGNLQYTSANCGAMTFSNMFEGGAYTLVVTGATSGTCTFSQASPDSVPGGSFKFVPANGPTVASKTTVYTLLRAGNMVYVSWIAGY